MKENAALVFIGLAIFVVSGWFAITVAQWLVFNPNHDSLEGVIRAQFKELSEMTITEAQRDAQVRERLKIDFDAVEKDWQAHEALNRFQYEPPDPKWNPNRKTVCYAIASASSVDFSRDKGGDPASGCYEMVRDSPDAEWVVQRIKR